MLPKVIQAASVSNNSGTGQDLTATFAQSVTPGNALIVWAQASQPSTPTYASSAIVDGGSDLFSILSQVNDTTNNQYGLLGFCNVSVGGFTTVTVKLTQGGGGGFGTVTVFEVAGLDQNASDTGTTHVVAGGSGSSAANGDSSGQFTTNYNGEFIVAGFFNDSGGGSSWTAGTSPLQFTIPPSGSTGLGAGNPHALEYAFQSSAGSINPSVTLGTTGGYIAIGWGFKTIPNVGRRFGTARIRFRDAGRGAVKFKKSPGAYTVFPSNLSKTLSEDLSSFFSDSVGRSAAYGRIVPEFFVHAAIFAASLFASTIFATSTGFKDVISAVKSGGGNNFTRNLAESFALADALTRLASYGRPLTEAFSLSDSILRTATYLRSVAESFSVSDALSTLSGKLRLLSESLSFSDLLTRLAVYSRAQSETFSFSDLLTRLASYSRQVSESFSLSDSVSRVVGKIGSLSETFSFSDTLNRLATYARGLTETLSFSDAVTAAGHALTRLLSETFSFSDTLVRLATYKRTDTAEVFSFSDSLARLASYSRTLSEGFSLADVVSKISGRLRQLSEAFSFADSLTRAATYLRPMQEALSFLDQVFTGAANHLTRAVSETFSFADSLTRLAVYSRLLQDSTSLVDALAKRASLIRLMQETFSFADSVSRGATYARGLSEAFGFSDAASFFKIQLADIFRVAVSFFTPILQILGIGTPSIGLSNVGTPTVSATFKEPL